MINKNTSRMLTRCAAAVGLFALGAMPFSAWAQNKIQSIAGALQGGTEIVRIELAEPLSVLPTGFAIQAPARIALDIPNATNSLGKTLVDVNQGNLKTINVVEGGERARLVLNLKQPTSYKAELQGKVLLIILDPVASTASASTATRVGTLFAQDGNNETLPLRDVDFRRSPDGAGRIVVNLPNSQVGVDLRQEGKGLVVDFLHSSLPEGLRRKLDVADFGTPVQVVTTAQQGDRVRMHVESAGEWEHNAYQSDTQFVVEVRQKKVDLNKLTQGPGFNGEKLSLNFQNIEVRSLLQVIADFTNFNIVTSDTVTGSLTLRLKDVPWDQALQIVMDSKGLGMRKTGSVLWIAPKDEIDERAKKDYEALQAIQKLEPLRTEAFQLNYAKASDLALRLTASAPGAATGGNRVRFLTERGSAIAEPRTNQLFVTDTPSKLEEIRALLAKLDIPVRQVLIEARIVEARETFGRSLGVRLGASDLRANRGGDGGYALGNGGNRVAWGTDYSNAVSSSGAGGTTNSQGNFVNLPAVLSSVPTVASFALSIFNSAANRFLTLELSAMEADGKGKVISSPRLITADQTKAIIEQGNEFPTQAFENNTYKILWKKAVLKLEVTPQITPEGNIIMDLDITRDNRGDITPWGISVNTRHVQTQVLVENGGTVAIGGVFEMEETNTENKVPVLGDVPVVGNLFKSQTKEAEKRELLIFVTPKVVTDRVAAN
ncbi:type IV pilus assembly protein PilQ [Paenacidovorax caeni]|uniref:Type IV pilus biogenesis and competence protein PilQ n=1 Tax=Paenacidovorax caeni TaxID=343013 RepID=A0A1I7JZ62_9BURK|nr:type IV pilus secretin PilQ [Paenacidovorax caeni]SFU90415.1 type IV pilus assembly protein PilQ [Paenacidovorax caeni]